MYRSRLLALTVSLLLAMVLFPTSRAFASAPSTGSGVVLNTPLQEQFTTEGGNTTITALIALTSTGLITGAGMETLVAVVHPTGEQTFQAWSSGIYTVDGITGEALVRTVGSGPPTALSGHLVVVGTSGGLTGFHAEGTFTGNYTGASYTLNYHFTP